MVVPLTLQYFYKMTSILEMLMHSKKKKKKLHVSSKNISTTVAAFGAMI